MTNRTGLVSALALAVALGAAGCSQRGHGGGGAVAPGVASAPSRTNDAQWRTALEAIARGGSRDPVALTAPGLQAYNVLVARNWPHLVPRIRREATAALLAAIPAQHAGGLSVLQVTGLSLDLAAPPALTAAPTAHGQRARIELPRAGSGWSLTLEAQLGGTVPIQIGGLQTAVTVQFAATAQVRDVQITLPLELDLRRPERPELLGSGTPQLQLQLQLSSPDPLFSQLLPQATAVLDPVVRIALVVAARVAEREIAGVIRQGALPPGRDWGKGGPPPQPPAQPVDLAAAGEAAFQRQLRDHMPYGNLYPAVAASPNSPQIVSWRHFGDSALWTGVWLGVAAYREDVTGRQDARAKIDEVLTYYDVMTRVTAPATGLLARTALPASSPVAADLLRGSTSWVQRVDGRDYAALGNTSRDSYTGTIFGLGQAYHRLPRLRPRIAPLVDRLVGYLESHGWMVYQAPRQKDVVASGGAPGISVTFAQAPMQVAHIATVAALASPARWTSLRDRTEDLLEIAWFNAWASSYEVHEGYYGFHLAHLHALGLVELLTEPDRYRAVLRTLRLLRETLAHHHNAMFDTVWAIAAPPVAATLAPRVETELALDALRPIRGFTIRNSADPSIDTVLYTTSVPNQTGSPGSALQTGTRSWLVARYPVPIPKRPSDGYLWSSSPFVLDGAVDPREQHPGQDISLPYWIARSHGLLP